VNSRPDGDENPPQAQRGSPGTYSVAIRDSSGVQVGERNTQIIYTYNNLTWTDGVVPPPLANVSGVIDSPYRGLSAFEEQDAPFFFGREEASEQLLERMTRLLDGPGLMVVSGVSGAGKSSLLRAGVLPRIRGAGLGSMPGSTTWPCLVLTPGGSPLDELALRVAALAGIDAAAVRRGLDTDPKRFALTARQAAYAPPPRSGDAVKTRRRPKRRGQRPAQPPEPQQVERRLLLIIDQFEQVFTQCSDEGERQAFATALCAAAGVGEESGRPAAIVVLGVRADFEARCADYAGLSAATQDRYLVTTMSERQLRIAITEPAKIAGSRVDDDLVEVLLADARARQPGAGSGALPLLSHALDEAWRSRAGQVLALPDYERVGGIEGAVARSAQRAYDSLTPGQQSAARQVFTRLTATTSDGSDVADRATRAELTDGKDAAEAADVEAVLEAFAAERLLTLAADSVEISHEALLTAWPLLRDSWLAETHADRIVRTRLHNAAAEWQRSSRDPSYLYSGTLLEAAFAAVTKARGDPAGDLSLGQAERDFLHASDRARRRAAQRRTGVMAGLVALILVAGSLAGIAVRNAASATHNAAIAAQLAASAEQQHAVALSRALAAESLNVAAVDQPLTARQLAVAAWSVSPTSQADAAMSSLVATQERDGLMPASPTSSGSADVIAFSPNGKVIATGDSDGTLRLWDMATRQPVRTVHVTSSSSVNPAIGGVAFSPNGKTLVTADGDRTVDLWDLGSGRLLSSTQPPDSDSTANPTDAAISPNGNLLAVPYVNGQVWLWNAATGQVVRVINADYQAGNVSVGGGYNVWAVAFSPDGRLLATADGDWNTRVWNVATGHLLFTLKASQPSDDGVGGVAFSPDGKTLATADGSGAVQLWNVATRRPIGTFGHFGLLTAIAQEVNDVAFSPNGKYLAATDWGGDTWMWNVGTGRLILNHAPGDSAGNGAIAFSPDSSLLADTDGDGTIQLWSTATALPAGPSLQGDPAATGVGDMAFGPGNDIVAGADSDGTVRLWNDETGQLTRVLRATTAKEGVESVIFSPNGNVLASIDNDRGPNGAPFTGGDGVIRLWNPTTGKLIRSLQGDVGVAAFSPDGGLLVTGGGGGNGSIRVWNASTGQPVSTLQSSDSTSNGVDNLAFSPNGQFLASSYTAQNGDGMVQLWDTATGQLVHKWVASDSGNGLASIAFSPNDDILATGGGENDDAVKLWSTATGRLIRSLRITSSDGVDDILFSPDGTIVASADADGNIQLWSALTGKEVGAPLGIASSSDFQDGATIDIAFSPNGKLLAGTAADGTIQFWNPTTGRAVGGPFGPTAGNGETRITFSPNGALLGEVPISGAAQIWGVSELANPFATLCADAGAPTRATWTTYAAGEKEPEICPVAERDNA